jgi:hypothetical protein
MSKFMTIVGILLVAVAVALGLMIYFSTASIVSWGISFDTAVVLLVGGVLSIGLGGVISALDGIRLAAPAAAAHEPAEAEPEKSEEEQPEPARKAEEAKEPGGRSSIVFSSVSETIDALEQAKNDIRQALGGEPIAFGERESRPQAEAAAPAPPPEPPAPEPPPVFTQPAVAAEQPAAAPAPEPEPEPEPEEEPQAEQEDQLYVQEERIIRNRPARILSDGTVEAETDEGWMRFENLEHLDEYLDAVAAGRFRA